MKKNIILILAVYFFTFITFIVLTNLAPVRNTGLLYIKKGQQLHDIYTSLLDKGYVQDKIAFVLYKNIFSKSIKAGEYQIVKSDSPISLLGKFDENTVYYRSITITEGLPFKRVAEILRNTPYLTGKISNNKYRVLLPETYNFVRGDTRDFLLERMEKEFFMHAIPLWQKRKKGLPLKTLHQAIVLASIVEKETAIQKERPLIASVFINRLRKGMPLQSDTTIIYALSNGYGKIDRPLQKEDFKIPSPFNTYYTKGLPPKPISNFSLSSLKAVLHPKDTPYYYFMANTKGGHSFSETLKGHHENLRQYKNWKNKNIHKGK